MYAFFAMMFGVPNDWSVSKSGQFTSYLETPQWLDALSYMQKLYKAGVFYPGSAATDDLKNFIITGKIAMYQDGVTAIQGGAGLDAMMKPLNPTGVLALMVPPAHDGGARTYWNGNGLFGLFTAIKKGSAAHTDEMLRIMDYCASPSFSTESLLINNGIKGRDYNLVGGNPIATSVGTKEVGWIATYIAEPPSVYSSPGFESAVKVEYDYSEATAKIGTDDPSQTLYSPTNATDGATLSTNVIEPAIQAIVEGRQTVSSWATTLSQWKSQGGSTITTEFEKAYAAAKHKS
jgi:putative aldouronate transport system substrate-binding protein